MDASTVTARDLFGPERRHVVPLYQRPYVWNEEEQWEPMWQDVRGVAERQLSGAQVWPHFLGAVVLDPVEVPYGRLPTYLVIDGQQRLTTLQILLEAVADVCANVELANYHRAVQKLTRNDDPLSKDPDDQFKVWPTTVDQQHFRRVMLAASPEQLVEQYTKSKEKARLEDPIPSAYCFFYSKAKEWILLEGDGTKEKRAEALVAAIRENLRFVVIQLKDQDDAQLIFETLNARGTPLLTTDLIKNHVFHEARRRGVETQALYDRYWKTFDEAAAYWREELGRGHAARPRVDSFLQAYLSVQKRDVLPVTHLYTVFKAYFGHGEGVAPLEFTKSIREYADLYVEIDTCADPVVKPYLTRLTTMGVSTAWPFLLELFRRCASDGALIAPVLATLESFLVRRLICQLNTRGYNALFIELLSVLEGEPAGIPARLAAKLLEGTAETNRWPTDVEFRTAFESIKAYKVLARPRVNMVLTSIETSLHTVKSEKVSVEKLTIEHLMPQNWRKYWNDPPLAEAAAARRDETLHRFGNLTLLTNSLNPGVGDAGWSDKLVEILKHSHLTLNREIGTQVDPKKRPWSQTWDELTIEERGALLSGRAVAVWPRPATPSAASLAA